MSSFFDVFDENTETVELPSNKKRKDPISSLDGKPYSVTLCAILDEEADTSRNSQIYSIKGKGTNINNADAELKIQNFNAQTVLGAIQDWNLTDDHGAKLAVTLSNILRLPASDIAFLAKIVVDRESEVRNEVVDAEKKSTETSSEISSEPQPSAPNLQVLA